jgi:hypothetical protein
VTGLTKALLLVLLIATTAAAQEWYRGYGRGYNRVPPRLPKADSYDGSFSFCRGLFTQYRGEPSGSGWSTDYPDADVNFSIRLSELTKVGVGKQPTGDPNHIVVPLSHDYLFNCPYLLMSDVGTLRFSDLEVERVRAYLLKGGFLWVDDSWGSMAIQSWEREIARVLSPDEYPVRDIPPDHPIFRMMFDLPKIPQIPSISHWRRSGGGTSERGYDSDTPVFRGISNSQGHLMVVMTHNTDISDAWEREAEDPQFFLNFSPQGYAVGLDVVIYGMTH